MSLFETAKRFAQFVFTADTTWGSSAARRRTQGLREQEAVRTRPSALLTVIPGVTKEVDGSLWFEGRYLRQADFAEARELDGRPVTDPAAKAVEEVTGLDAVTVVGRFALPASIQRGSVTLEEGDYLLVTHGPHADAACLRTDWRPAEVPRVWLGYHSSVTFLKHGAMHADRFRLRQLDIVEMSDTEEVFSNASEAVQQRTGLTRVIVLGRLVREGDRSEFLLVKHGSLEEPCLVRSDGTIPGPKILEDRPKKWTI